MYSDDEKDVIDNSEDSQENIVSWDNLIDTDEDGIVSIKNSPTDSSSDEINTEVFANETDEDYNNALINELVKDVDLEVEPSSESNITDDDELIKILSEVPDSPSEEKSKENTNEDSIEAADIDMQFEELGQQDEIVPRKEKIDQKQRISPVFLALIFALIVAAVFYFVLNSNKKSAKQIPQPIQNMEQEIDSNEQIPDMHSDNSEQIPVVNEEEISSLKPDENQDEIKDEKKEVVNIVPTGRINPFMPIGKYIPKIETKIKVKTINNIDYDSITIPKPPKEYGELSEKTDKLMSISVSGIMYDKVKPSAIITYESNDYFVLIGDKLDRFRVVDIGPTYVKIALGKNIYKANVGEKFVINDFYGNSAYQGKSRQYFSSEEEYKEARKEDNNAQNGYTSDTDVKIYSR